MAEEKSSLPTLIDTHCHLDFPAFDVDRAEVVAAARQCGVTNMVVPAVRARDFARVVSMRVQYGCAIALGLHPLWINEHTEADLATLDAALRQEQPCAVGEIGLDFADPQADTVRQEWFLVEQLQLACRYDLPVLLHTRRSLDRVLKYVRRVPVVGGIVHAFNGSEQQAKMLIDRGFKLGFGGSMSYAGSTRIRRLAATLPLSAIVLETDAPDMPPQWAQGQRNHPQNIRDFAQILAELRGISYEAVAEAVTRIAEKLFFSAAALCDYGAGGSAFSRDGALYLA